MARKPKATETAASDDRGKLLDALRFASIAIDKDGAHSFVAFRGQWLTAENETFAIGCPVATDLDLCPQADLFTSALNQCGQNFQLTQVSLNGVSIKSGNFRALVPALSHDTMSPVVPDAWQVEINDNLKTAFAACSKMVGKKDDRLINKCVLMRSGNMIGTNGGIAIEYWHGLGLPTLCIPIKTAETISKITKSLRAFGMSDRSATFFFEDGSFLKTRLIAGEYPNVDRLFEANTSGFVPIWPSLYAGISAIKGFCPDDSMYFDSNRIGSHRNSELGASYAIAELPGNYCFSILYWLAIEPYATHVAVASQQGAPHAFYGPNVRGLIMGKNL